MFSLFQPLHSMCDMDVPCFAMELEQDIARLEAEADRDELVTFSLMESPVCMGSDSMRLQKCLSDDDVSMQDQNIHASDADSDDGGDEELDAEVARIRENALSVVQYGKTLIPGAWRGCAKSAWCDREDRHRGLCNHRATIAGPAAIPAPAPAFEQEDSEEGQDASNLEDGGCGAAACSDVLMQAADEQQLSGGHSHNCQQVQEACAHGDEREVDSALQTAVTMEYADCMQHQHSSTETQLQQHAADAGADTDAHPVRSTSSTEDELSQDLFWCGNAGQLAAAELFSIPAAYQPRVKDLTAAPGAPCLLGMNSLCDISTPLASPLAAPMPAPVEEEHEAPALDSTTSSDYSDHTNTKACTAVNSGASSTPSSPSCASASAAAADLAAFGPFQPKVLITSPSVDAAASPAAAAVAEEVSPAVTQQGACSSPHAMAAAYSSEGGAFSAPAEVAEAAEAAALAVAAAAAASACAEAEAAAAAAVSAAATTSVAVTPDVSMQAAYEQAAAEAAAAEAVAAAAAAAAALAACAPSPGDAAAVSPSAAAAAAMGPGALGGLQRPPRIKSKPSNSLMKAAAISEASCSPKSKKRPASRMASNPGGGHCCTSCGAVSTPVWRAGPAGPKTLCNACGVRYMKVAKKK